MAESDEKPTCFIAMPITTQPEHLELYGGDEDHWGHVMGSLFERAIEEAGFRPIRPAAKGAHLIHAMIIQHLSTADLVLVDLSTHNPNVFFELGVRTSLNLPIALVRDELTTIPFDTSGINTHKYDSNLRGWELEQQRKALTRHIVESHASCGGENPLWRQFGLTIKASEPDSDESPREAKLDLIVSQIANLQNQIESGRHMLAGTTRESVEASFEAVDPRRASTLNHFLAELEEILAPPSEAGPKIVNVLTIGSNSAEIVLGPGVSRSEVEQIRDLAHDFGIQIVMRRASAEELADRERNFGKWWLSTERRRPDLNWGRPGR